MYTAVVFVENYVNKQSTGNAVAKSKGEEREGEKRENVQQYRRDPGRRLHATGKIHERRWEARL